MTKLSIVRIAGQYCGTHSEAEKVFAALAPFLRKQELVQLDFDQVELTSSSFFNELFGQVSEEFGQHSLEALISYASLKPRHKFVLERMRHVTPA